MTGFYVQSKVGLKWIKVAPLQSVLLTAEISRKLQNN